MAQTKTQTVAQRKRFLWDEINALVSGFTSFSAEIKQAKKQFEDFLIDAYLEGFASALYFLDAEGEADRSEADDAVNKYYDGESIWEKFEAYYAAEDAESLTRLVESEFHRVNERGGYDAAKKYGSKAVKKRWSAILDSKTRMTHGILDGTEVGLNERFFSISGDSALYPGDFLTAEENANCRCMIEYFTE